MAVIFLYYGIHWWDHDGKEVEWLCCCPTPLTAAIAETCEEKLAMWLAIWGGIFCADFLLVLFFIMSAFVMEGDVTFCNRF